MNDKNLSSVLCIGIFIITLVILLLPATKAETNYLVSMSMQDKNLEDDTDLTVDIIGNGGCERSGLHLLPESKISLSNNYTKYADSFDPSDLEYVHIKNVVYSHFGPTCSGKETTNIIDPNRTSGSAYFKFHESMFKGDGSHYARTYYHIKLLPNSYGGDYKIRAIFICEKKQETQYFESETEYPVMYLYEKWQYLFILGGLIIAVISYLFGKISEKG